MVEPAAPRTLLEAIVRQRQLSWQEAADLVVDTARQHEKAAVSMSGRHLGRLARGERSGGLPYPATRRALQHTFGRPIDELLARYVPGDLTGAAGACPSPAPDPRALLAAAARDSLDFASWADAETVSRSALDHLTYELGRIAVDYVHAPLLPLFRDLVSLRDTTKTLLQHGPNPRQSRELFFLAGVTCTLLAHATQNLGDPGSARAQAHAAWSCAEQADHDGLRAWVRGTQALISEWTRRPGEAVQLARSGQEHAAGCESLVRLAALEARALARTGDTRAAVAAVEKARRVRESRGDRCDDLDSFGGVLSFPLVKQTYYAGSTLALAGRHEDAERTALEAIRMYESGPCEDRSYGDEALARVDVGDARLALGDLDGTVAALHPVLQLPAEHRIEQISTGLARTRPTLALPQYARTNVAIELGNQLDAFGVPRSPALSRR